MYIHVYIYNYTTVFKLQSKVAAVLMMNKLKPQSSNSNDKRV